MAHEFEIRREHELPAAPEQVFDAVTTGTAAWLWPTEHEPRVGGSTSDGGTVTGWDPPRRFAVRAEGEDGWFNALEFVIEARAGGGAVLRYVHSGIFVDDWDNQYDAASKHTDFYLHTLGQYLRHFSGRSASYVAAQGPASSAGAGALAALRRGLGLADDAAEGDTVRLALPGLDREDVVVDYLTPHFIGLRASDGLYRFFVRSAWGAPVGVGLHLFADGADREQAEKAWSGWLDGVYA